MQENDIKYNKKEARRKKLRRKRRIFRCFVIILLVLSAVVGNQAAAFKWKLQNTLNLVNRDSSVDLKEIEKKYLNGESSVSDDSIINILLIGADKRESWNEAGRSDSCMIATIDMKHKKLKLTSLMRDMYVDIPGYGKHKFNAAYSYGGVDLLYKTILSNFGFKVEGYALVDFAAFKKVINELGGVKIKLTDAEHSYLMSAYHRTSVLKLKPGINNMNGTQALAYCRIRQDIKGDFGRTERQRYVIGQIFTKMKTRPLSKWYETAEVILPEVTSDLTAEQIMDYMTNVILMGTTEINQLRIPIDGSFSNESVNGQDVLAIDIEQNVRAYNEFVFENLALDTHSHN
ncbi:MAG: LytR family transcriptional regulator [Lachnospiraceae bacterium]|nr:LytR family transcriptional regulator [Lachnospiraceae bacterium]